MTIERNPTPSHVRLELVESAPASSLGQEGGKKAYLYDQSLLGERRVSSFSLSDGLSKERDEKLKTLDQAVQSLWNFAKQIAQKEAESKGVQYVRCEVSLTRREIVYFDIRKERYLVTDSSQEMAVFFTNATSTLLAAQNLLFSCDPQKASSLGSRAFFQSSGDRWTLFSDQIHSASDYEEKVWPLLRSYLSCPTKIQKAEEGIQRVCEFILLFEEKVDEEIFDLSSKDSMTLEEKGLLKKRKEQKQKLLELRYDAVLSVAAIAAIYAQQKGLFSEGFRKEIYRWMNYYLKTARVETSSWLQGSEGFGAYLFGKGPGRNLGHENLMQTLYAHQTADLAIEMQDDKEFVAFERKILEWANSSAPIDETVRKALDHN